MGVHQFNNEPLRILLASLASGIRPTDAFIASTFQKHLFREVRLCDAALKHPETLRWNNVTKRWANVLPGRGGEVEEKDEEDIDESAPLHADTGDRPEIPTQRNPLPVAMYAQLCIAAKSYQSALCTCSAGFISSD